MTAKQHASLQQAIESLPVSLQPPASRAWERIVEHNKAADSALTPQQTTVVARMLACSDYAATLS